MRFSKSFDLKMMCAEKSGPRKWFKSLKKSFQNSDFRSINLLIPDEKHDNQLITRTKPSGLKPNIVLNKNRISLIAIFKKYLIRFSKRFHQ